MGESSRSAKITPWLNLMAGSLWLLAVARDIWMPGFLSISGRHDGDFPLFNIIIGTSFLVIACRGFMQMRRNPAR